MSQQFRNTNQNNGRGRKKEEDSDSFMRLVSSQDTRNTELRAHTDSDCSQTERSQDASATSVFLSLQQTSRNLIHSKSNLSSSGLPNFS